MKNFEIKGSKARLNCTFKITEVNFFPVIIIQFVILKTISPEIFSFLSITFIQKNGVSIFWYVWDFSCEIQALNDTVINVKIKKKKKKKKKTGLSNQSEGIFFRRKL